MGRNKILQERIKTGASMWCENCSRTTISQKTVLRFLASGRQIQEETCSDCGCRQETEFFKGPGFRVKNRSDNGNKSNLWIL